MDESNELQADGMLFRRGAPDAGALVDADGYVAGAPELVVEVAASSASHDLGAKMRAYERSGVQEYVVWQILEERIDWFRLVGGRFGAMDPVTGRTYESKVFPGLRLDAAAMIAGDLNAAVAPMDQP